MEGNRNGGLLQSLLFSGGNSGGGGGGGIFAVTTRMGETPGTFANANHNATEIMEALENNQLPVLFFHMESGGEKHTTPANYKTFGGGGGNPWYVTFTVGSGNDVRVNDDYSVEIDNS